MAGAFGLLHGFGFARALAQVGLPSGETPSASLARVTIRVSNARRAGSLRAVLVTTAVLLLALGCSADADDPKPPEIVVLLHGLARTDWSMKPLEVRLEKAGYVVENLHYGSMDQTPEEILAQLRGQLVACCSEASKLHFVTHSLGGILTRAYVAESRPENLGRVVMIAPPNKGSELADWIAGSELLSWTMGPTAVELGTDPDSLPNRLPPADFEVGIIAGTGSVNPFEGKVAGENDGTVSVESTKLEGMTDFITMPYSHTFIMQTEPVARQVVSFLQTGPFARSPSVLSSSE